MMKKTGRWILSLISKTLIIILVILLLPFARTVFSGLFPNVNGEIQVQRLILEQKLQSSQRLEVTTVDEVGVMKADTSVILLGTVGSTTIRYRYTASLGINLSDVQMTSDQDRIIFCLPDAEIMNDGIEPLEINRQNLFSRAIDKSVETLLNEQRMVCREQYLTDKNQADRIWSDTVSAFDKTIRQWLEQYGERHYQFEYIRQTESMAAE